MPQRRSLSDELTLTRLLPNGECLGFDAAGHAVSVRGAVPGDRVQAHDLSRAAHGFRARRFTLIEASPERDTPRCAVQASCGGCGLMPLALPAQQREKLASLSHALARAGLAVRAPSLQASPHAFGYRNRLRLRIDATGVVHFFNAEKRPDCVVLEPDLRERVARVRALSEQASELFAAFEHLELRSADLCGIGGLWLAPRASTGEASTQAVRLLAAELPDFAIGVAGNAPVPWQRRAIVEGVFALVPLDAFVQVNSATNADLVAWLRAWAVEVGARSVLDLYAGAGNFSLALAARGLRATAVETHAASIDALAEASRLQRLPCEGFARTAHEACLELAGAGRSFDLVVLDPPRAGALATAALAASLGAPHMALCSCDVESFARDLGVLTRHGYRVHAVRAFDMFPHTHHVEVLALLQRTL